VVWLLLRPQKFARFDTGRSNQVIKEVFFELPDTVGGEQGFGDLVQLQV
jgi:hypothetical protein